MAGCYDFFVFLFEVFGVDNVDPAQIYRGPYFLSQPEDKTFQISVDAIGECQSNCKSATFDCEASGYPHPTYKWFERTQDGVSYLLLLTAYTKTCLALNSLVLI